MKSKKPSTLNFSAEFQNSLNDETIYDPDQLKVMLARVRKYFRFSYSNKKLKYFNVPAALDIETSSFYNADGQKCAIIYEWTLGIFGTVMIGRTYEQLENVLHELSSVLDLNENKRLIIYVHNLSYEFQFIRKHFEWIKIFAVDNRKPVYAVTDMFIEFRCSYLLSGYSLDQVAKNLTTCKIKKLIGDLDYSLIRHSTTPLTASEIAYCVNDVKIVMAYIQERIISDNGVNNIPLTKTGYVRKYCRNKCFYTPGLPKAIDHKRQRYKDLINTLTLQPDEYRQLKRAFQGGFTHANPFYSNKTLEDVTSYDFTSSYPAVMVSEKFPMSAAERVTISSREEFDHNLHNYCCLFDIEFYNLQSVKYYENYISRSRCFYITKGVINNGRVVSAEVLRTSLTEVDFMIISQFYTWDRMRISNFKRYKRDYLPTDFIKAIIDLYQNKTKLKGVAGSEAEYLKSKEMLNSCYGMTVTDIVRPNIIYDHEWCDPETPDINEAILSYNDNAGRFMFYPWGVWVTAYARRNLFTGILEFSEDYIYSDTDSIKCLNAADHAAYIDEYNKRIIAQLKAACDYHHIPVELIAPKTIKGVEKPLGVWDFDGHYTRFKTLGAKRYMVEYDNGDLNITVSGLNKRVCVPYIKDNHSDPFEAFNDALYIPAAYTGKNTHTYIDEERSGIVTDYLGRSEHYQELSSVHLEAADYSLSISKEYADYIRNINNVEL